jgi:hypothetical protein
MRRFNLMGYLGTPDERLDLHFLNFRTDNLLKGAEYTMKVNIYELLTFLDNPPKDSGKHSTSLVSIFGEELSVLLFKHYLANNGQISNIGFPEGTPKKKGKKGRWLDKWITVDFSDGRQHLYQAEVKSWSAHATNGKPLEINATSEKIREFRIKHWGNIWDRTTKSLKPEIHTLTKVLTQMHPPAGLPEAYRHRPLVIYWMAIHPEGRDECYFTQPIGPPRPTNCDFDELEVFSVSSYLRTLQQKSKFIDLELPDIRARLELLRRFFPN